MMRAPSEIRCRSIPKTSMATNTMASTSGIATATTAPARRPRLTRLTARTMATASHRASRNSSTACSTVTGWSATRCASIPTGRSATISAMACSTLRPSARTSPPVRMATARPMASSPVDAEHRLRWVGGAAGHARDVAQADHPAVGDEVDGQDVPLGPEVARDPDQDLLVAGLHHARGRDGVLGLQGGDQRGAVDPEPGQPLGRELDVDALVLRAEDVDLGDVRQLQQPLADLVHVVPQLLAGEAVGGEAVDDAVGVAELVVEERAEDAERQRVADVAHLLAHLVPDVRHPGRGRRVLQVTKIVAWPAVV